VTQAETFFRGAKDDNVFTSRKDARWLPFHGT
jgi:hypothetical protein